MEYTIQDVCREAKEQQHKSLKDISDISEVSINTVTNFFSSASKSPSFYTVAPICKALGVSMDEYSGIVPPMKEAADRAHDLELENVRLAAENALLTRSTSGNRRNTLVLLVFNTILTISLLCYLIIDANIRTAGLILFGEPSAAAYALIALSVLSVLVIVAGVVQIIRRKK